MGDDLIKHHSKIISPLKVPVSSKKSFILNLNNYRNAHYQILNKAKVNYKAIISEQLLSLGRFGKIKIAYKLFPATRRRTDIGNVIAIHKKFFEDALTEFGVIKDDSYEYVISSSEDFGGVSPGNGRVEIFIQGIE